MSQCRICLENYSGTYYAGSEIRGRIECYFDDETTVRGIKIEIKCKEHNEWTGTEEYRDPTDNSTKTRHITLTGDHDVFHIKQMLFGSESGSREVSRGHHVYPFSYHLPYDIPSSYHGPHGSIIYKIKAVVDRPMRTDYEDKFIFNVVSPIDFNRMSKDLQETTSYSDDKTVCCWCCQGGVVTVELELPKIAFTPGETIPFKVNITNLSNTNVDNIKIKLRKTVTFRVTDPQSETKVDVDDILSFGEHGVGAHGEHTYNLTLAIPPGLEVPNFTKCNLFKVEYLLKVTAEMDSCTMDLDVEAWDIQLGHVQYTGTNPPPSAYPPTNSYPPSSGVAYPPPLAGVYPPPSGGYPPAGFYPPPAVPAPYSPGFASNGQEKTALMGPPSAPMDDNPKAREAAMGGPSAPSNVPDAPPPTYSEVQQASNLPYPAYPPK
ncbi:arrestin domain-containing protein 3-like [Tribolium madens]|uniref:arrestin domain-containing protein 3-like n=1 Tax=Tribolium madens TaxID=41895 RepID=UPI001CF75EB4|nr:arrestin domain-containing protein 3-like [Tribolium madens]